MATMKPLIRQSSVNDKWVGTCKICRLFLTNPEIWVEFHDNYDNKGWKQVTLINWLNEKIPEINLNKPEAEKITEFNRENVTRHLKGLATDGTTGHCKDFLACKNQIENGGHSKEYKAASKSIVLSPEVFQASDKIMEHVNNQLTEFMALSEMIKSLERVLAYYDTTLKQRMDNREQITIDETENYQKQVSGYIKLMQDMSKLRNTAKIAGDAVESAIKLTTFAFIEKLVPLVTEASEMVRAENPNSTLPDELKGTILNRMKDEMQNVIPVLLDKILSEYKIK